MAVQGQSAKGIHPNGFAIRQVVTIKGCPRVTQSAGWLPGEGGGGSCEWRRLVKTDRLSVVLQLLYLRIER